MIELISVPLLFGYIIWILTKRKSILNKKSSLFSEISSSAQSFLKSIGSEVPSSPSTPIKPFGKSDVEEFEKCFVSLVEDITKSPEYSDMPDTNKWLEKVLNYNVPFGKKNRGIAVAETYRYLMKSSVTEEDIRLSYILGWCVEILQACYLVADDIMDGSEYRRGRLAWYKVDDLGAAAFNDSLFMESCVYFLLEKHFSHLQCYSQLVNEFHSVTHKTLYGQSLDTRTALDKNVKTYTNELYDSIVKYKTSYYTFCLPVKLAMILAKVEDKSMGKITNILLKIGHYFQVQDDYLDCFGDPSVTGKVGTDIADTKCSWLFVKAKEIANPKQRENLITLYEKNSPDKVAAVTEIYRELDLPGHFKNYEDYTYNSLVRDISSLSHEVHNSQLILHSILSKIFNRKS